MSLGLDIKNALEEAIYMTQEPKEHLPQILENNKENKVWLDELPRIYLVVRYFGVAILEFPFSGKYEKAAVREENYCNVVPLVYQYDDCNGTDDSYFLRKITNTTTGWIIGWCYTREAAEELRLKKEKEYDSRKA